MKDTATYEFGFILHPQLSEKDREDVLQSIKDRIATFEGDIFLEDVWGLRDLAYPIEKQSEGYYVFWYLNFPKTSIIDFKKWLSLQKNVIRVLIMKKDIDTDSKVYSGEMPVIRQRREKRSAEVIENFKNSDNSSAIIDKNKNITSAKVSDKKPSSSSKDINKAIDDA
jgi:small subunit ribosomal protein S6